MNAKISVRRTLPCGLCVLLMTVVVSGGWGAKAHGELVGDASLLRLVAIQNRANLDAIVTWQGQAEVVQKTVEGGKTTQVPTWRVAYAFDRLANKYMFHSKYVESAAGGQGKDKQGVGKTEWAGVRTPEGYYRMPPATTNAKGQSNRRAKLILESPDTEKKGDFAFHFDALWYLDVNGMDIHERFMFFHDNGNKDGMPKITVSRDKNLVTVVVSRTSGTNNRYVFNLDQGACPVEFGGSDSLVKEEHSRTYVKVAECWVPSQALAKNTILKTNVINSRTVVWIENVVNQPLPDQMFSLDRIGLRAGDLIRDANTKLEYRYGQDTSSSNSSWYWPLVIIFSLLGVASAVIVFGKWAVRRRAAQRERP